MQDAKLVIYPHNYATNYSPRTAGNNKPKRSLYRICKDTFSRIILAYLALNLYLELPLDLGSGKVLPAFPYILFIPITFLWIKKKIRMSDINFLWKVEFIFIITTIFSAGLSYWQNKILGDIQISISIIAGLLLFRLMTSISYRNLERLVLIAWSFLLIGALLEVIGLMKSISDVFREWAYSSGGYAAYANENRDFAMFGRSRPCFFTSEPSLVAMGFMLFINSWFVLRPSVSRLIKIIISTIAAWFVIGSPIIFLSLTLTATHFILTLKKNRPHIWIWSISMILIILTLFTQSDVLQRRFSADNFGENVGANRSENIRIFMPFFTAFTVAKESPVFGVGVSGKQAAAEMVKIPVEPNILVSNNIASLFIYLGFVGSTMLIYVFIQYFRRLGIKCIHHIFIFWSCIAISMGAFESPRFWGYLFFIAGIYYHADKLNQQQLKGIETSD